MSVEVSFPATASGDANIFARELRAELAVGGVPHQFIKLARGSHESMDIASVLQMSMEAIVAAHAAYEIATVIFNFSKRKNSLVRIKSADGDFDVTTDSIDPARLSAFLQKVAGKLS